VNSGKFIDTRGHKPTFDKEKKCGNGYNDCTRDEGIPDNLKKRFEFPVF
jgi:hypothetical protein